MFRDIKIRRLRLTAGLLACVFTTIVVACGRRERHAGVADATQKRVVTSPNGSEMTKLRDAFSKATPPQHPDLTGVWAEIRSIQTRKFLEGRDGPDQVSFDSTGLRSAPNEPLSWTLTFTKLSEGRYVLKERMGGQVHAPENVKLDSSAGFRFTPDFGSDQSHDFDCRVVKVDRMVCLEREYPDGDGGEFAQISRTVPPPPPPSCPMTCVSECSGLCDAHKPLDILAEAKICYHLLYPLTHEPTNAGGTDTWLVLSGDSMPPLGKWQYAAVFDDSVVRLAAWRRLEHTPPNANDPARRPYPNGLQLALTMTRQNMRGELGYGSGGVSGTMFHEESPYSWGISGDRQKCPAPQDVHTP